MRQKLLFTAGGLLLACLTVTACQGKKATLADSCWNEARQKDSLYEYAAEKADEIDMDALKQEAEAPETALAQQFKTAALLNALELYSNLSADGSDTSSDGSTGKEAYRFDYPASASYAENFLAKAADDGEAFWKAIEESFYPYDCFDLLFAAADKIDGKTLSALYNDIPQDSSYKDELLSALDKWVEENPVQLVSVGDALMEGGYFEDWDADDWKQTYFHNYSDEYSIQADTADDAAAYISYIRSSLLPELEEQFGKDTFREESKITKKPYYTTLLTVSVEDDLTLAEPDEDALPDKIKTKNHKVAAFYRNLSGDEFEDSPPKLRMLGDFMLQLSEDEYPDTMADADYYLVLTPAYEYGEFYQDNSGNETKIQEVYSRTSVDLYDAKTGAFLRHLGNVLETPATGIFDDLSREGAEYPQLTGADALLYMYHNINKPDTYITLLDNTAGSGSELERGESIVIGSWEITYLSSQTVKSFDEGMFRYTASDGCQYVRASFQITNRGSESDTFLPMVYRVGEDPIVQIADAGQENVYMCVDALTVSSCLNSTSLEPGASKEGELFFEVPDKVLQGDEPLYVVVSMGHKSAAYRLNE